MSPPRLPLLLALALAACSSPSSHTEQGSVEVIGVADGDTITVRSSDDKKPKPERVRLYGVDCPERKQPHGVDAKQFTSDFVLGKKVEIVEMGAGKDRYGRTVAKVWRGKIELGQELLANGLAWHSTRHDGSQLYAELQRDAKTNRRGLWADSDPQPPWEWRKRGKRSKSAPSIGPFHGNVRSKVLHSRTCRSYSCKNCTEIFATTTAAKRRGYRLHDCVVE